MSIQDPNGSNFLPNMAPVNATDHVEAVENNIAAVNTDSDVDLSDIDVGEPLYSRDKEENGQVQSGKFDLSLRTSVLCTDDVSSQNTLVVSTEGGPQQGTTYQCTDDKDLPQDPVLCSDDASTAFVDSSSRHYPVSVQNKATGHYGSVSKAHHGGHSIKAMSIESISNSQAGSPMLTDSRRREGVLDVHTKLLLAQPTTLQPTKFVDVSTVSLEEMHAAYFTVDRVLKDNPRAHGVVLLAHHQDVPESVDLDPLVGIENGAATLYNAFTDLGLAVVWLKNPSTAFFKAVVKVMASCDPKVGKSVNQSYRISYPKSFKYLFFYTTGHGARRVFFTKDCAIAYSTVYNHFKNLLEQRYFFFDCCRTVMIDDISLYADSEAERELPEIPGHDIKEGNKIVYATLDTERSGGPGDGVSFMTKKMVILLRKNMTVDEMINTLKKEVPSEVKDPETGKRQQPMLVDAAQSEVHLMELRDTAMKGKLDCRPTISPDGYIGQFSGTLAIPLVKSESFEAKSTYIQMKQENGNWYTLEDKSSTEVPQSLPITFRSRSQSTLERTATRGSENESLLSSYRESCRDSVTFSIEGRVPPPLSLDQQQQITKIVTLLPQQTGTAEVRMVTEYKGGMKTMSDSLTLNVPATVPPTIQRACLSSKPCHRTPSLCVSWTTQSTPSIQQFQVKVYAGSRSEPVYTETVPVYVSKTTYSCCVPLRDYQSIEYSVIVEAEHSDGQMMPSTRSTATKGCFFRHCECAFKVASFLLSIVVGLVIGILLSVNCAEIVRSKCMISASETTAYTVFNAESALTKKECIPPPTCFLCNLNFNQPTVSRNVTASGNEYIRQVYCSQFSSQELASSQTSRFIGPDKTGIDDSDETLRNHTINTLPIGNVPYGVYLLPHSQFYVYLCLSETPAGIIKPSVEVLLFEYQDWTHTDSVSPLKRVPIQFDEYLCSNTTVNVTEAALTVTALSTSSEIKIKAITGSVTQVYYKDEVQDRLTEKSNLVKTGDSIPKNGNDTTKLLCYIYGGEQSEVYTGVISIAIPFAWKNWVLKTLIPLALLFLLGPICVCFFAVVIKKCKQYTLDRRSRSGYVKVSL